MGECLCGFEGPMVRPSLGRVLRSSEGRDLLCCSPTLSLERLGPGGGKLEAVRGRLGMLGAVCIRLACSRGDPRSELERGASFRCQREAAFPGAGTWARWEGRERTV